MARCVFNVLTLLSLLLLISSAALWLTTRFHGPFKINHMHHDLGYVWDIQPGKISYHSTTFFGQPVAHQPIMWVDEQYPRDVYNGTFFTSERSKHTVYFDPSLFVAPNVTAYHRVEVSLTFAWFGILLPIIWFGAFGYRVLAIRNRPKHLCRQCGYDLRATPLRCPECALGAPPRPVRTDPAVAERLLRITS